MHRVSPAAMAGHARGRGGKRAAGIVVPGMLMLFAVLLGRAIVETQAISAEPLELAGGAAGVMSAIAVMLLGPVPCIAAIAALAALPLLPALSIGGDVDLVAADAFFAALVCWWLIGTARPQSRLATHGMSAAVSGAPVLLFLAYAGLTLVYVAAVDPDRLSVSAVSWIRLVQTAMLGWLAASFMRTRRDVTVILGALAMAGAVAVVLALVGSVDVADAGPLAARGGGVLNPNTLGLVSGLLVLMAAFGAPSSAVVLRLALAACGVVGLIQSRSVGSLFGTSIALMLGLMFIAPHPRPIAAGRWLKAALALALGIALAYSAAYAIRPENLPTSARFGDSSAGQRLVLAAAGLELVERNPIIGVGWRRSEQPAVIGDPGLNADLRARFPSTSSDVFPDVSPTSVHNAYVQVAADLGLIGLGLFLLMLVAVARRLARVAGRLSRTSLGPAVRVMTWGLVMIAIWWNDNPLFGGQAETVIPAVFVGAIAGLSRQLRPAAAA
jgi:O-antigen ligase